MSRFDCDDGEGMPWELWETVVSNALGGRRGQAALAEMEAALLALPAPALIHGHLATETGVCAIGALVAHHRAEEEGVDIEAVVAAMVKGVRCCCGHGREQHEPGRKCAGKGWKDQPCWCDEYDPETEDSYETVDAGVAVGLSSTIAWHLAYLNDEQFARATPEQRYEKMLAWVRRAQGKEAAPA